VWEEYKGNNSTVVRAVWTLSPVTDHETDGNPSKTLSKIVLSLTVYVNITFKPKAQENCADHVLCISRLR
jgi:hypothetical protein